MRIAYLSRRRLHHLLLRHLPTPSQRLDSGNDCAIITMTEKRIYPTTHLSSVPEYPTRTPSPKIWDLRRHYENLIHPTYDERTRTTDRRSPSLGWQKDPKSEPKSSRRSGSPYPTFPLWKRRPHPRP
jgi:hypothetical protein